MRRRASTAKEKLSSRMEQTVTLDMFVQYITASALPAFSFCANIQMPSLAGKECDRLLNDSRVSHVTKKRDASFERETNSGLGKGGTASMHFNRALRVERFNIHLPLPLQHCRRRPLHHLAEHQRSAEYAHACPHPDPSDALRVPLA